MLSLPSARRLVYQALLLLFTIATIRLCLSFQLPNSEEALLHFLERTSPRPADIRAYNTNDSEPSLEELFISNYHQSHPPKPVHQQVIDLLTKCKHTPNPITNHIRLPHVPILNISMIPSKEPGPEFRNKKYFNPAILPLPAHVTTSTGYTYLLISRLVTDGHHQESHLCFADLCFPNTQSGARSCTGEDIELLGEKGGLRCITEPERLNIPPTPARKCTGAWSTFPDIPGFHDPRVFWSGRGEPLVEVNSGSLYGCIGLWVVDLRSVFPKLGEVLRRSGRKSVVEREEGKKEMDMLALGPRMEHKYLTEITRNPSSSRNEVEKNWVLFFPTEEETWVQYDMMGRADVGNDDQLRDQAIPTVSFGNMSQVVTVAEESPATSGASTTDSVQTESLIDVSVPTENEVTSSSEVETSVPSTPESPPVFEAEPDLRKLLLEDGPAKRDLEANHEPAGIDADSISTMSDINGGRSLAQLISHGYTTPNLTHPLEQSCFDFADPTLQHDKLNNSGHWHQGSNSLRLILCTRSSFQQRSCMPDLAGQHRELDMGAYEEVLRDAGFVVHFSVVHRKFSNTWKLPMRYERYLLVWEARGPYRMLGISSWPILFGTERARPWSYSDDFAPDNGNNVLTREESGWDDPAYFTYTPSIAWAWRPKGEDETRSREHGHDDLGTGFPDDNVIVGLGMDDTKQGLVQVKLDEVLGCLRLCPGVKDMAV